ncbi:hypothetical protein RCG17_10440 [Neobacillus sp. PS3-12]|uniref:hypothetical protein n=1 Tax=Neobacillus sp. PS3-12 TaxID=3070677 RepID=UPI0027E08554|nr:hypothetical protein [Neobacillus sp. PS3-12]WML54978.1 hypothetical protein RCG17_10440 [Neobacillus sp. PS3-12]
MNRCKVCRKKPKLERRVNCEGIVFCSDECYENYEHSLYDDSHPYIDDYDAVRFEYMEWMRSYEADLYKYGPSKKEDLVEGIESVIEEFSDYIRLEGSDGVFSKEIYHYLLALEELIDIINNWEPSKSF